MLLYEFKVHLLLNPARTVYLQFPEHRDCTCPFEVKAVGCVQRKKGLIWRSMARVVGNVGSPCCRNLWQAAA